MQTAIATHNSSHHSPHVRVHVRADVRQPCLCAPDVCVCLCVCVVHMRVRMGMHKSCVCERLEKRRLEKHPRSRQSAALRM